jgi:hypothetical protein
VEAFQRAGIHVDRAVLEFLFDVVGEKYNTVQDEGETTNDDVKVLSITYFINKLFSQAETSEMAEVDQTLQNIKAALIYKGLDFSVVFAENSVEHVKKVRRPAANLDSSNPDDSVMLQKRMKEAPIDLTQHYTRFAQQLVASEFCQRVEQLNARGVTREHLQRLANFLALNQKN